MNKSKSPFMVGKDLQEKFGAKYSKFKVEVTGFDCGPLEFKSKLEFMKII